MITSALQMTMLWQVARWLAMLTMIWSCEHTHKHNGTVHHQKCFVDQSQRSQKLPNGIGVARGAPKRVVMITKSRLATMCRWTLIMTMSTKAGAAEIMIRSKQVDGSFAVAKGVPARHRRCLVTQMDAPMWKAAVGGVVV